MDLGIDGKVAVVLGAGKGMGLACARALAAEGCRLAVCSRTEADLSKAFPVEVLKRVCDVTKDADRETFLKVVLEKYGQIDILINNCGGPKPGAFGDPLSAQDWADAFERSLLQVVKWTEAVIPHMKGWGRIVNIVSTSVKQPIDSLLLSSSIRPGVIGYAKAAARGLGPKGITINSILPGAIRTERATELAEIEAKKTGISVEAAMEKKCQDIPARRMAEPEEVGALAAFLCSKHGGYITGTTVTIDGGMTRTLF